MSFYRGGIEIYTQSGCLYEYIMSIKCWYTAVKILFCKLWVAKYRTEEKPLASGIAVASLRISPVLEYLLMIKIYQHSN